MQAREEGSKGTAGFFADALVIRPSTCLHAYNEYSMRSSRLMQCSLVVDGCDTHIDPGTPWDTPARKACREPLLEYLCYRMDRQRWLSHANSSGLPWKSEDSTA